MGYRDLIDISLNVDASELYAKLEQLDGGADTRLGSLEERVKSIEDGGYPVDQDKVEDIIASYLVDENYQTRRDVENFDYQNEGEVESLISSALDNSGYQGRDGVKDLIRDELEGQNFASDSIVEDQGERIDDLFAKLKYQGERLDAVVTLTEEDVQTLIRDALEGRFDDEKSIESLVERLDVQANNLTNLTQDFDVHIKSLEEQVKAQDSAIDALQDQLRTMQEHTERIRDNNVTAMRFFDLIKQAFALLKQGA